MNDPSIELVSLSNILKDRIFEGLFFEDCHFNDVYISKKRSISYGDFIYKNITKNYCRDVPPARVDNYTGNGFVTLYKSFEKMGKSVFKEIHNIS